jgi:hypothetical protein
MATNSLDRPSDSQPLSHSNPRSATDRTIAERLEAVRVVVQGTNTRLVDQWGEKCFSDKAFPER